MPNLPAITDGSWKAWGLLALGVVLWGINWPIMKIGLAYSDPVWFAALRSLLAAFTLVMVMGLRGRLVLPAREDLPVLFTIGVIQVGGCMTLVHSAVLFADAGRSAVLAYTTPIWAVPLAILFLSERPRPVQLLSLLLGIAGLAVLFFPTINGSLSGDDILGIVMPSASAVLWAGVIIHVRAHRWKRPLIDLMPWQFLVGGGVQVVLALILIGPPAVTLNPEMLAILFYNGVPATVVGFWAYLTAARHLQANATAMGSLGIPLAGLIASSLMLGESLSPVEWLAVGLLTSGIALSTFRFGKG